LASITRDALLTLHPAIHSPFTDELTDAAGASNLIDAGPIPQSTVDAEMTVTGTETDEFPPGPVHEREYVYTPWVLIAPRFSPVLAVGRTPAQLSAPVPPLATHDDAFVVLHFITSGSPGCICAGFASFASSVIVGAPMGAALTATEIVLIALAPPAPVQTSE
jgi:hypothetical protein